MKSFFGANLSLLCLALLISSCTSDQNADFIAPARVEDSLIGKPILAPLTDRADGSELVPTDKAHLVIKKSALGKEFLFQGSMLIQFQIPSFEGLKSRIVFFERKGEQIVMLESPRGHQATDTFPQQFFLASFDILEETADSLTIDFNKGMSKIFVSYDWFSSDFYGSSYFPEFLAIQTRASFINSIEYSATNKLVVDQMLDIMLDTGGMSFSVRAKYYFQPYRLNPTYEAFAFDDFSYVGYFQANPILEKGGKSAVFATRHNPSKPIVYAISANTPAEYKDAVRDGILYWNKAFGKDMIQVVDAPEGVSAPHPDYNLIQWVEWDDAGFAYADAQMDPLTGEILHAQVFMTSAFAVGSKETAEDRLLKMMEKDPKSISQILKPQRLVELKNRALRKDKAKAELPKERRFTLKNFFQNHSCRRDFDQVFAEKLKLWLRSNADDAAILKASQDYIREVIAHEVGHTLGLRHNFAGTASGELRVAERDSHIRSYLKGSEVPANLNVSSSVMDYHGFQDAVLLGARIRLGGEALAYDRAAIQNLYGIAKLNPQKVPYFCTDTDLMMAAFTKPMMGCDVFDSTANTFEDFANIGESLGEDLPYYLAFVFAAVKTLGFDLSKAPLFPTMEADYATLGSFVTWYFLADRAKHIQHRYDFPFVSEMNLDEYHAAIDAKLVEAIQSAGGFQNLLPTYRNLDHLTARFTQLIKGPKKSGVVFGKAYEFTDAEIEQMIKLVSTFEAKFDPALVNSDTQIVKAFLTSVPEALLSESKKALHNRATKYLLGLSGMTFSGEVEYGGFFSSRKVELNLPTFKYSAAERITAVKNLFSSSEGWVKATKAEYRAIYESFILAAFDGVFPSEIPSEKMPAAAQTWLNEVNAVLEVLK